MQQNTYLLSINGGSSSLKFGLFFSDDDRTAFSGHFSHIGGGGGRLEIRDAVGNRVHDESGEFPDAKTAMHVLTGWLLERKDLFPISAIGHRLVQGGPMHRQPELIDEKTMEALESLIHLAPNHLPASLKLIRQCGESFPGVTQIACYDTYFHRDLPAPARHFAIPRNTWGEELMRYGFHGLSYEYIMHRLGEPPFAARRQDRIIIAHLGNGSSMCAVRDGRSIDTTMGLTPTGGLIMGTRSGDLDPGVLLYIMRQRGLSADQLEDIVNKKSGLEALSGNGHDVKELLAREEKDIYAAEALAQFCYQARKYLGSLAAALGGLDMLVFTGGIGENAAAIRNRMLEGLGFMGIELDEAGNAAAAGILSAPGSPVTVAVIPTNEETMIARHMRQLIKRG